MIARVQLQDVIRKMTADKLWELCNDLDDEELVLFLAILGTRETEYLIARLANDVEARMCLDVQRAQA